MLSPKIKTALILAAGFGKRMRPLTDHTPKPLLPLNGSPLLDPIIEQLQAYGIEKIIINGHHLAEQIAQYASQKNILFVPEEDILETAGGIKNMLSSLPKDLNEPIFVINGDIYWKMQSDKPLFQSLNDDWDPEKMDALLWLVPKEKALFSEGKGDYFQKPTGLLQRNKQIQEAPFIYGGVNIIKADCYQSYPEGYFKNTVVWDDIEKKNRLYGQAINVDWYHIGTPEALKETERLIKNAK